MRSIVVRGQPLRCEIKEGPIPYPGAREVLIRVLFCASNSRDWMIAEQMPNHEISQGVEMSGIVEQVGYEVYEFSEGDRVAAVHPVLAPGGAYAEFATAPVNLCFHVPHNVSMEGMFFLIPSPFGGFVPTPLTLSCRSLYHSLFHLHCSSWTLPPPSNPLPSPSRRWPDQPSHHHLRGLHARWSICPEASQSRQVHQDHRCLQG